MLLAEVGVEFHSALRHGLAGDAVLAVPKERDEFQLLDHDRGGEPHILDKLTAVLRAVVLELRRCGGGGVAAKATLYNALEGILGELGVEGVSPLLPKLSPYLGQLTGDALVQLAFDTMCHDDSPFSGLVVPAPYILSGYYATYYYSTHSTCLSRARRHSTL